MARPRSADQIPVPAPPADTNESAVTEESRAPAPVIADPGEALGGGPQMPEVQEGAIAQAREGLAAQEGDSTNTAPAAQGAASDKPDGQTDFKGRRFDPILHEVNADGSPRFNRDGFICCRRGAPKVAKGEPKPSRSKVNVDAVKKNPTGAPGTVARVDPEPQIQATAQTTCALIFAFGQMVGGEEFAPEAGEPEAMQGAFANYYRAKGIQDIPPGVAVSVICVSYVLKRWNKPQFKEKRESWWMKLRRWWNDWKFRKENADGGDSEAVAKKA